MVPPDRSGWPAVFACFCLALFAWSFGFYGQAVFLAELQRQNGWSSSLVSAATTSFYLMGAVALAFVPEALDRVGRRPAIICGMVLLAGSASALPAVRSVPMLYLAELLMAVGWALTSGTAVSSSLAPWFGRRRGLAISLALNGASAAGFTTVPVLIATIGAFGFATGIRTLALVLLAVVAPVILLALRPPGAAWRAREDADAVRLPGESQADGRPAPGTRAEVLGDRRFWLVAGPFALGLAAQVGFIVHQVALLQPRLGPDRTGIAVALTAVAALVGRIAVSLVIDRLDRRTVTAASFALQAASLGAILLVPTDPVLYLASFTFGLSVGNAITLPALVVLDEFAPAAFGLVLGLVTASNQFLYAFGPAVLGFLRDLSGGYGVPLVACMALETAAVVLVLAGRPARSNAGDRPCST